MAARYAAQVAAMDTAWWWGTGAAAQAVIKVAAKGKLEPTRRTLQTSAAELIDRMIELKEAA